MKRTASVLALAAALVATGGSALAAPAPQPAAGTAGTATGTVLELHSDGQAGSRVLQVAGRLYDVPTALAPGTVVTVTRRGAGYRVRSVVLAPRLTAAGSGEHHITAVLYSPPGTTPDGATTSSVAARVAAVAAFYRQESGGAVDLVLDRVVGWTAGSYGCDRLSAMFNDAARRARYVGGPDRHLALVLPDSAAAHCASGTATVGGSLHSGGFLQVTDDAWKVLAHEVGHNLSLEHATSLTRCTAADPVGVGTAAGCTRNEYGDGLDVMGGAWSGGHLDAYEREQLGLTPAVAVLARPGDRQVQLAATDVALTAGLPHGSSCAARVTGPDGVSYWLEYRTPAGRDADFARAYPRFLWGVRILKADPRSGGSQWIDPTPATGVDDATLRAGSTWTNHTGRLRVTVTATTSATATVSVRLSAAASGPAER